MLLRATGEARAPRGAIPGRRRCGRHGPTDAAVRAGTQGTYSALAETDRCDDNDDETKVFDDVRALGALGRLFLRPLSTFSYDDVFRRSLRFFCDVL